MPCFPSICPSKDTMNASKPTAPIIVVALVMAALCVSLDAYVTFGDAAAPTAVSNTMCILRPLGHLGALLLPDRWPRLVSDYCATFPREPVTSIIALTVKCSIVGIALIVTLAMYPLREKSKSVDQTQRMPTEPRHAPIKGLFDRTFSIALFCLPPTFAWRWFVASAQPDEYSAALMRKAYEDIFLMAAYVGGIVLWITFCEVVLLPILRRLFPGQAWMRVK
jgi:hypothetical protein